MDKEKLVEYQLLEQQINALNQNLQNIEQSIDEIKKVNESLDEFKTVKKGDKMLVSLANGVFAEAKLETPGQLKVNVGKSVVVTKNVDETKALMEEQIKELEKYKEESLNYYEQLYTHIQKLQTELVHEEQNKN